MMSFTNALRAMLEGKRIRRASWSSARASAFIDDQDKAATDWEVKDYGDQANVIDGPVETLPPPAEESDSEEAPPTEESGDAETATEETPESVVDEYAAENPETPTT